MDFENRPVRSRDIKGVLNSPLPLIGVARSLPLIGLTRPIDIGVAITKKIGDGW